MPLWRLFYNAVLDALFPLSPAEEAVAKLTPEIALETLPRAPEFGSHTVPLPGVKAVFSYKDDRVSKLVWGIKYKKSAHFARIAGYALWRELSQTKDALLVPMPMTARRRRERGYNQCELLVDEVMKLDTDGRFSVAKDLLMRTQHKSQQKLNDRSDRLTEAKGIFTVNERTAIDKKLRVIVIDDVITTGSTMKEAIDTLSAAGFENVSGISLAH